MAPIKEIEDWSPAPLDLGDGLCRCPCHDGTGMMHVVACCNTCPHCGQRIESWAYGRHVEACKDKPR